MKKSLKIIFVIVLFVNVLFFLQNIAIATDWQKDMISNADGWGDKVSNDGGLKSSTQNVVGTIINVIRIVGTGIAIIMITYVAIKYMMAAPNEKAEFKKSATAMVVGAMVLFAATNLLKIIANFASSNISAK